MGRKIFSGFSTGNAGQLTFENFELREKLLEQNKIEQKIKNENIEELKKANVKFSEKDVIFVTKTKEGKLTWLEKGNSSAGLNHIIEQHGKEFINNGIKINEIPKIIKEALIRGEYVGIQGRDRKIYKVRYKGNEVYIGITISKNGFIVGANITTKPKKEKKDENH